MSVSQGRRVKLNVSDLPWFFFCPGQVVAVSGVNSDGTCIRASHLMLVRVRVLASVL